MAILTSNVNYIDALLRGDSWTGNNSQSAIINYNFNAAAMQGFGVPAAMRVGFTNAMTEWSHVAKVTFKLNGSSVVNANGIYFEYGDLSFISSGVLGATWSYTSGSILYGAELAIDDRFAGAASVAKGTLGYLTILHELGHALGLEHPGSAYPYAGTENPPDLPAPEDTIFNTVMSYDFDPFAPVQPSTPMIYDIAAMQYLYGANTAWNAGATTYTFTGASTAQTLWDGGGVDTINATYAGGSAIDLREGIGYYSSIGAARVWNAFNARIENATTGVGNDSLIGSDLNNKFMSGAGNDTVTGNFGADTVNAGAGGDLVYGDQVAEAGSDAADRLFGEAGNDTIYASGGNDYVSGGNDQDQLFLGSGNDSAYGDAGNDTLFGHNGLDTLYGGTNNDLLYGDDTAEGGGDGADKIYGDAGNDMIYAGGGADYANGGTENDILYLGTGNDTAYGGAGNDTILADAGNDSLFGDAGNDFIRGEAGNDTMNGGAGIDIFYFGAGEAGADTILSFEGAGKAGGDVLRIAAADLNGNGLMTAADLAAHMTYSGGNAFLDLGGGQSILLKGITIHLVAGDFLIG